MERVNIDVWVEPTSQILGHSGFFVESGTAIFLEKSYSNYLNQVYQQNAEDIKLKEQNTDHITPPQLQKDIAAVLTNKKFSLPTFNRHTSIRLNILVENFQGNIPDLRVSILHKSVKLVKQEDRAIEEKKRGLNMIVWGIVSIIIGSWIVRDYYRQATIPILITAFLGVINLFTGHL